MQIRHRTQLLPNCSHLQVQTMTRLDLSSWLVAMVQTTMSECQRNTLLIERGKANKTTLLGANHSSLWAVALTITEN